MNSTPDPDANFAQAEELIELAARRGADLVGLPENFAFMGEEVRKIELAPRIDNKGMAMALTAPVVQASLSWRKYVGGIFDGPRLQQYLPMIFAGVSRESSWHHY